MDTEQFLLDLHRFNDTEMAHKYKTSRKTIYRKRKELGIANPYVNGATQRPVFNLPEFEDADSEELWDLAEELRKKILDAEYRVDECEVSLIDTSPVMLVGLFDWHVGHINADMEKLKHDLQILRDLPGAYVLFGGDYTENTNTSRSKRGTYHEQLVPIRIQKRLAEQATSWVENKILAMVKGNHDAWSEESDDFDFVEYLAKKIEVPYFGDVGFLNISLGSQEYRGLLAHKGRGGGKDKTAGAKNLEELQGYADFTMVGHRHESAISEEIKRGVVKVFASAGAYPDSGRYSRSLSLPPSYAAMPGVILFPNQKKVFPVRDAMDNLWALEGARAFG